MKSHIWRPLYLVLAVVLLILLVRPLFVPADFASQEQGYLYGFHRQSDEADWRAFPAKYRFAQNDCDSCHDQAESIAITPHAAIACENCHGPARQHPDDPATLNIDRSRQLCLRCHFPLPYPTSDRADIRGVNPQEHYPDSACVDCHNPHAPALEA